MLYGEKAVSLQAEMVGTLFDTPAVVARRKMSEIMIAEQQIVDQLNQECNPPLVSIISKYASQYTRHIDKSWNFKSANTKEYTHIYHTYPAMMIPQIARRLIAEYAPQDGCTLLFDPYCGSGTSLVEASLKGIHSIGTDLNPLARLLSYTKTRHLGESQTNAYFEQLQSQLNNYAEDRVQDADFSRITNCAFWYSEDSLMRLSYITQLVNAIDGDYQAFFKLALAETVREVSFTRKGEFKRFRMQEDKIRAFVPNVFKIFTERIHRNITGLHAYNAHENQATAQVFGFNSTEGIPDEIIADGTVDMVVTSPPYGDSHTTVAYGQFSRWANEWFDFEHAKNLDSFLMGGGKCGEILFETETLAQTLTIIRNEDEKRYREVCSFLNDYWLSICNVARKVRKGGMICYVVGNRRVKNRQIDLDYFTAEMFEKNGCEFVDIIVRDIPSKRMPLKNSPTNEKGKLTETMNHEYIVIMRKVI